MGFGIALAGGGARGAAHVGVLLALEEAGLPPSSVAGTSAGGIVAGLYAAGLNAQQLKALVQDWSEHGRRLMDPDYFGMLKSFLSKGICLSGLIKGQKLEQIFVKLTEGKALKKARMRTVIPAVDLNTGNTIAYTNTIQGVRPLKSVRWNDSVLLSEAMRASSAFPAIFHPKNLDGMCLVDGGVADNLPVNLLLSTGEKNILGIDVSENYKVPDNQCIIEIASHSLTIMQSRLKDYTSQGESLVLNPSLPDDAGLLTFDKMIPCMEAGYQAVTKMLPAIKRLFDTT